MQVDWEKAVDLWDEVQEFLRRNLPGRSEDSPMKDQVRIGNGCGFWGDNLDAPICWRNAANSIISRSSIWPN